MKNPSKMLSIAIVAATTLFVGLTASSAQSVHQQHHRDADKPDKAKVVSQDQERVAVRIGPRSKSRTVYRYQVEQTVTTAEDRQYRRSPVGPPAKVGGR